MEMGARGLRPFFFDIYLNKMEMLVCELKNKGKDAIDNFEF